MVLFTNNLDITCFTDTKCPDRETKTGTNGITGEPFCHKLSNDTDLTKSETLLSKIADNTSLNKNSNTQLGNINSNVIRTNSKLEAVKGGLSIIDTSINNMSDKFTNKEDGTNYIENISNGITALTSGTIEDDKQLEYKTQLQTKVTETLNDTFTKYSNSLGFGSTYATAPDNITVTLYGKTYTILDFSVLDDYVSIIRTLFLSLAYLFGFLYFLRGGK